MTKNIVIHKKVKFRWQRKREKGERRRQIENRKKKKLTTDNADHHRFDEYPGQMFIVLLKDLENVGVSAKLL